MDDSARHRIFLLSPAYAGGERARMILSDRAEFELARKLRCKAGAPIAEVFTFLSGLYFRGKIAYATAFADRKSTRLNSSHRTISYAVFCLKKKTKKLKTL